MKPNTAEGLDCPQSRGSLGTQEIAEGAWENNFEEYMVF